MRTAQLERITGLSAEESAYLSGVWSSVDELLARAPSLDDLRDHRLQLLAARRWQDAGERVPSGLLHEQRAAAALTLPVQSLLARIGGAWGEPMILMKGPELASRYPTDVVRAAGDLDLLVADTEGAHTALRAAGFALTGDPRRFVDIHHLQPLVWPGLPIRVELHRHPKWIEGLEPPSTTELLELAEPSRVAAGYLALVPEAHAVLLAVHSWAHEPLGNLRDLLDVALLGAELDPAEAERLARRWGVWRVWRTTHRAADSLFAGGTRPFPLRTWARHLVDARARTVFESHAEGWLSCFAALPLRAALGRTARRAAFVARPIPGETWRTKLARTRVAIGNSGMSRSAHERRLEELRLSTPDALLIARLEERRARAAAAAGRRRRAGRGPRRHG